MKFNLTIKLIYIGKIKKNFNKASLDYYSKLISNYANLKKIQIKDIKSKNIKEIKKREGEEVLKHVDLKDYLILMDERGTLLSSKHFAQKIENIAIYEQKNIVFVIGGPYGHSFYLKQKADFLLSLSPMTFPHELSQVILLEQIYRSFTILTNHPYHNA